MNKRSKRSTAHSLYQRSLLESRQLPPIGSNLTLKSDLIKVNKPWQIFGNKVVLNVLCQNSYIIESHSPIPKRALS